jgi:hypothetical protein
MNKRLEGKVAVITGAAGNIGQAAFMSWPVVTFGAYISGRCLRLSMASHA